MQSGPRPSKDELARDGKSLLAVYEFLVEKAPPPKTFQAEVDALPGASAMSKLLNGKRRILSLTFHTDLEHLTKLLAHAHLRPALKNSHFTADENLRALALALQGKLVSLEGQTRHDPAARTKAAADRAAGGQGEAGGRRGRAGGGAGGGRSGRQAAACGARSGRPAGEEGAAHAAGAAPTAAGAGEARPPQPDSDAPTSAYAALASSQAFASVGRMHSERTLGAARAIVAAQGGPFTSPTKTGETRRQAEEVLDVLSKTFRTVHSHQEDPPSGFESGSSTVNRDAVRLLELATKYPKVARGVVRDARDKLAANAAAHTAGEGGTGSGGEW